MKLAGIAALIAVSSVTLGSVPGGAQSASNGCPKPGAGLSHSQEIARDPTAPATIGGCGIGQYKLHHSRKLLKEQQEQQILTGPDRTGSGSNL